MGMRVRRRILLLAAIISLALPATLHAQFTFVTTNGAITITKYTGSGGAVTIPDKINGFPVAAIGYHAFLNCFSLTSVTIPNSVISISDYAFSSCTGLKNVTVPNGVTGVGLGAFIDCFGLTNLTIGSGVTNIGDGAFSWCPSLTSIIVDTNNPSYSSVAGVLFNKSLTALIAFPGGLKGNYAISNSVTTIGNYAFLFCTNLSNVTIPNGVTSIGDGVFSWCIGLTNIVIPDGVTRMGTNVFYFCTNLTSVTIGSSVTNIDNGTFYDCYYLVNVAIPNSVIRIGDQAFYECAKLTNVMIPNSVTSIGNDAFELCYSLTAITVDAINSVYSSVDGVLFNKNQTMLIECPPGLNGSFAIPNSVTSVRSKAFIHCARVTSVTVPGSVTSIGNSAFFYCTGLTNIVVANGVTSIGNNAFEFCAVTSVEIPGSITNIGQYAFYGCSSLTNAYFLGNAPADGYSAFSGESGTAYYLPGTTGWGATFGGWPTVLWYQPEPMILGSGYGLGVKSNGFGFTISWATNAPVVVESCTNLANPVWTPVTTNNLVSGTNYFSDPQWTNYPGRFYRIRSP
jgi:hypothetical protein